MMFENLVKYAFTFIWQGMGGQLENFGIWIDADFGKGHSSAGCSTYHRMPSLSSEKDFMIEHIEVWAVGPPPKEDSDDETVR